MTLSIYGFMFFSSIVISPIPGYLFKFLENKTGSELKSNTYGLTVLLSITGIETTKSKNYSIFSDNGIADVFSNVYERQLGKRDFTGDRVFVLSDILLYSPITVPLLVPASRTLRLPVWFCPDSCITLWCCDKPDLRQLYTW